MQFLFDRHIALRRLQKLLKGWPILGIKHTAFNIAFKPLKERWALWLAHCRASATAELNADFVQQLGRERDGWQDLNKYDGHCA
jgi:hypothetical protein